MAGIQTLSSIANVGYVGCISDSVIHQPLKNARRMTLRLYPYTTTSQVFFTARIILSVLFYFSRLKKTFLKLPRYFHDFRES